MLTNGWIQLCVGAARPELGRTAAPSDPHTVMFKRNQRDQMDSRTTAGALYDESGPIGRTLQALLVERA